MRNLVALVISGLIACACGSLTPTSSLPTSSLTAAPAPSATPSTAEASPEPSASDTATPIPVTSVAPTAIPDWPACTTTQLQLTEPWSGAGLGNAAVQITIQNTSTTGCTLKGYPDLAMVGHGGKRLATHVIRAIGGDYLFPAAAPDAVAIEPGQFASFMIGFTDNPYGPNADKPYDVACPPAVALRVILPSPRRVATTKVSMAPCNGDVRVSPIVPGPNGLRF
jgi:Protein of unknown function (DUF4232)